MNAFADSTEVKDLPVLNTLARANLEGRMPHAVLLTGADSTLLERIAEQLAGMHLGTSNPITHADCNVLRPSKKSRSISIDSTIEIVSALRLSSISPRRVVIVNEPDRFLPDSANAFLKSLEEPPPGTLIILQTTHYYRILPTILSRCLRFHVPSEMRTIKDPAWIDWQREMELFVTRLMDEPGGAKHRSSDQLISIYALCARFEILLELFVDEAIKSSPPPPPTDDNEEDAKNAYVESIRRGIRASMLVSIEEKLRLIARTYPRYIIQVAESVKSLEMARLRMELNYQVLAALEQFFLHTLRAFAIHSENA